MAEQGDTLSEVPSLIVTAPDPELPELLRAPFPGAVFASAEQVRAIIRVKPGSLVVLLDARDSSLVTGLLRNDVRAVAIVTPQKIPMMFRKPIVATIERPLPPGPLVAAF